VPGVADRREHLRLRQLEQRQPGGAAGAGRGATEAGAETASTVGEIISVHVIPRPHPDLEKYFVHSTTQ